MKHEEFTDQERDIIRLMAHNDLNLTAVGRELNYKRSSIQYYVEKIKRKTGLDTRKFYDEIKLLEMINDE